MSRAEKQALQGSLTADDTNGRLCFSLSWLVLEEIKLRAESCQESVSSGNVGQSGCSMFMVTVFILNAMFHSEEFKNVNVNLENGKGSTSYLNSCLLFAI